MYRQFYLVNGHGDVFELTNKSKRYFLDKPQGFGFTIAPQLETYSTYRKPLGYSNGFPTITGTIIFTGTNSQIYQDYGDFARFCQIAPLELFYILPNGDTYSIDVNVTSLAKTENGQKGYMSCAISMSANSFWKADEEGTYFNDYTQVLNNGDVPCGFEMEMKGNFDDPYFEVQHNGETIGIAKFIGHYTYVYVNSKDGKQNIILKNGESVIPNPINRQDLSVSNGSIYVTFVKLPIGVSQIITPEGAECTLNYNEVRLSV